MSTSKTSSNTPQNVRAHALQGAIDAVGSALILATYLGVPLERLLLWASAAEEIPQPYFLKLVDIICNDLGAQDRKALAAAHRVAKDKSDSASL